MSTTDLRNLLENGCLVKLADGNVYPFYDGRIIQTQAPSIGIRKNLYDQNLIPADASKKQAEKLRIDVISKYIRDLDLIHPAQWPSILDQPENIKWVRLVTRPVARDPKDYLENGCLVKFNDGEIHLYFDGLSFGRHDVSSLGKSFSHDLTINDGLLRVDVITRPTKNHERAICNWSSVFADPANIVWKRNAAPGLEDGGHYWIRVVNHRKRTKDSGWRMARYQDDVKSFFTTYGNLPFPACDVEVDHKTGIILRKTGE